MSAPVAEAGNDRDDGVVEEIIGYITHSPSQSFFLFAGAGSGKTRTLVEVLRRLTGVEYHPAGSNFGKRLRARGQALKVITYTKNAVSVINGRLGNNDLTCVSTIHSFCWDLIAGFDDDIREALLASKAEELDAEKKKAAAKKRGVSVKDEEKFASIEAEMVEFRQIRKFLYTPDRNTYGAGALQHAQVLNITARLIRERPTLRKILTGRHPVILIDESQDTMKAILDVLLEVAAAEGGNLTLGLIGDHRQRIYTDGHTDLALKIPVNWARPKLQMNHRSQKRIVELINHVWEAEIEGRTQSKLGGRQYSRSEKVGGQVRIFVGDSSLDSSEKIRREAICAEAMGAATSIPAWSKNEKSYQVLALEHKLAARRDDFLAVYEAMDLLDPDAASPRGNAENTGPAMVQILLGPLADLAACVNSEGKLNESLAFNVLQKDGCLSGLPREGSDRAKRIAEIDEALTKFSLECCDEQASIRNVLSPMLQARVFNMDERLAKAYADLTPPPPIPESKSAEPKEDRQKRGWHMLFSARWSELRRYKSYLAGKSALATHQVVKGSEFQHVMVVMDDQDAGGFLFSYDKVFGAADLSENDHRNIAEGKETTVDRTLRLLYVTCSRARESLALVLWARNPAAALTRIKAGTWFLDGEVLSVPS